MKYHKEKLKNVHLRFDGTLLTCLTCCYMLVYFAEKNSLNPGGEGLHFYYFALTSSILFLLKCQNTTLILKMLKSKF